MPPVLKPSTTQGLRIAHWASRGFSTLLLIWGTFSLLKGDNTHFEAIKSIYLLCFGALLLLPLQNMRERLWKWSFTAISITAAGFVFLMIFTVMFNYIELEEQGERLGVPGLEGTLVFLALMQPPVLLFQRRPDFLD